LFGVKSNDKGENKIWADAAWLEVDAAAYTR
jgi:hypothetical protein